MDLQRAAPCFLLQDRGLSLPVFLFFPGTPQEPLSIEQLLLAQGNTRQINGEVSNENTVNNSSCPCPYLSCKAVTVCGRCCPSLCFVLAFRP